MTILTRHVLAAKQKTRKKSTVHSLGFSDLSILYAQCTPPVSCPLRNEGNYYTSETTKKGTDKLYSLTSVIYDINDMIIYYDKS